MMTPLEERTDVAEAIGIERLFLKREDLQPTGSFKERAASRQIEHLVERGKREAVISSSGNAAIAVACEAKDQGVRLYVLVSPDLVSSKRSALCASNPVVIQSKRAMRFANYLSARYHLPNLRPSIDDHAVIGFTSLGEEIEEQMEEQKGAEVIVSFVTSGASLEGMIQGHRAVSRPRFIGVMDEEVGRMGTSRSPRLEMLRDKAEIVSVCKEDRERAQSLLKTFGLEVADEAVASFAWILKERPKGNVVWVVSGKKWEEEAKQESSCKLYQAETFEDLDRIYAETHF